MIIIFGTARNQSEDESVAMKSQCFLGQPVIVLRNMVSVRVENFNISTMQRHTVVVAFYYYTFFHLNRTEGYTL